MMRTTVILMTMMVTMMVTMKTTNGMMVPGAPMSKVSVGKAGVWAVNSTNSIFYRVGTYGYVGEMGTDWVQVPGGLKQLAVGPNIVWGVNRHHIYCRKGISKINPGGTQWKRIPGRLMHISVNYLGRVWGTNKHNDVYIRTGVTVKRPEGNRWQRIYGPKVKQISSGGKGVWALDVDDHVWYRKNTFGGCNAKGTGWTHVPYMKLSHVTSAFDNVFGISEGRLYKRMGISMDNPVGTVWTQIMMESDPIRMVDSVEGFVWTVMAGSSGAVYFNYVEGCCC